MKSIFIIAPIQKAYSETFIQNHIDYLPGQKTAIYSLGCDAHFEDGTTLLKSDILSRAFRFCERKVTGVKLIDQEIRRLVKFIKKEKSSCVLVEYGLTGAILTSACKRNNIPFVVHFHGYDAYRKDIVLTYQSRYKRMFDEAKAIIAVSTDMKEKLMTLGAREENIECIPYGIDLDKFKQKQEDQVPSYVLATGRFVEKKAPYLTILAFSKVLKDIHDAKLIMIGDGPLLGVCKQLVKSLGIEHALDFKGVVTHEEVAYLMRKAFCFVQHSLVPENGDSEGTPLAILEASASGLPVISTRHAGIKDAVLHEESGYLVEEGDIKGMAKHITNLFQNPELAYELGKKGREWISANYNIHHRINDLWQVLSS